MISGPRLPPALRGALLAVVVALIPAPSAPALDLQQVEDEVARRLETGSPESALTYLRTRLEEADAPEDQARLLWISAWIELQGGRPEAADLDLREAARKAPQLPFPPVYGSELRDRWYAARSAIDLERQRRAYGDITEALEELENGRRDSARRGLEAALESVPDHPEALYNLALLDLEDGSKREAIAGFERVAALASARPDDIPPSTATAALSNLGALYAERGLPEEAERVLRRALEIAPDHVTAWVHLGRIHRERGELEESRTALERARSLAPGRPSVADELALTLGELGRWNESVGLLESATRAEPTSPLLWLHLGRAQQGRGDPEGARRAFEEALRLDPDDRQAQGAAAALQLAALEWSRGRWEASFLAATRATDLSPNHAIAWVYRGLGHEKRGELPEARRAFETARQLDPRRGEAWANLARVAEKLGDRAAALEAYRRATDLDPSLPGVADGVARLSSGGPLAGGAPPPPPSDAPPPVTRPRLGVRIADVDYAALGISGLLVEEVTPGSPADRAGIRPDDLLLRADGRALDSLVQLRHLVLDAGDRVVTIDLLRSQRPVTVRLRGGG